MNAGPVIRISDDLYGRIDPNGSGAIELAESEQHFTPPFSKVLQVNMSEVPDLTAFLNTIQAARAVENPSG